MREPAADPLVPAGARCALHPDAVAVITCQRCGDYACDACANYWKAGALCRSCLARVGPRRYHVEPPERLLVLHILSLGLYGGWWCYKNWSAIKRQDRSDIWPIGRAVFAGIMYFLLIEDVNEHLRKGVDAPFTKLPVGLLGTCFLLSHSLPAWASPPPGLTSVLTGLCMLPTARRIAAIEGSDAVAASRPLRTGHYVLALFSLAGWAWVLWSRYLRPSA